MLYESRPTYYSHLNRKHVVYDYDPDSWRLKFILFHPFRVIRLKLQRNRFLFFFAFTQTVGRQFSHFFWGCWQRCLFSICSYNTRQEQARQGKRRQDRTRQSKARQDKTRQGKARPGQARPGKAREERNWQNKTSLVLGVLTSRQAHRVAPGRKDKNKTSLV